MILQIHGDYFEWSEVINIFLKSIIYHQNRKNWNNKRIKEIQ